jgi:hypothetical protein
MKEHITGKHSRGRRGAKLVGALGLLLAVVLLVGVLPVYAADDDMPPAIPHTFAGMVSTSTGPVPEGIVVEAFLEGVKVANTTVTAESTYDLAVPGEYSDAGKTVSFKVAGVQASQTTPWKAGGLNLTFDLTIAALPGEPSTQFPFPFECFIATAAYGTPTAEQIDVLREFRDVVLLKNTLGSLSIALYYRLSPPVAHFIAGNEVVTTLVRELLVDPIVWLVEATGDTWQN